MEEIAPGVWDWTTFHEGIGVTVHSHYLVDARLLLDPRVPVDGTGWFDRHECPPTRIVLTNRHHLRHAAVFAGRFECPILAHEAGLPDLPENVITPFRFGDEIAPGVTAHEVGVICPEETAIYAAPTAERPGVLAFADAVVRWECQLAFVPDDLLGDDPEAIKEGLRARLLELCDELDFDVLLLAHGAPKGTGGKGELRAFASS